MLFGEVQEAGLARGRPGEPTEGLGLYSGSGGVSPPLEVLFPTPHPRSLSKHMVPANAMLANVQQ